MSKKTNRILDIMKDRKHTVFLRDDKPLNLNIIEERKSPLLNNRFEDEIHLIWNFAGQIERLSFRCTTKAGTAYQKTGERWGIKAVGQYKGAYKLDKHSGRYYALCQRLAKIDAHRFARGKSESIEDATHMQSGMFGANIHRANYTYAKHAKRDLRVNRWSAMCTVLPFHEDFNIFMQVIKEASNIWGNKFTTTLIES
jgi:hypothetical protein